MDINNIMPYLTDVGSKDKLFIIVYLNRTYNKVKMSRNKDINYIIAVITCSKRIFFFFIQC